VKQYSKALAASATFTLSGLIHEYILFVICCSDSYYPQKNTQTNSPRCISFLGPNLAFFIYNGVLIIMEYAFIGTLLHQKIVSLSLPTPLFTCMVVGTALPVAHWFTDMYVECNIYESLKVGCLTLVTTK
jgi:hypothetical protein